MADFNAAYEQTIAREGGYVNDPVDRGGETFRGISRKHHPEWLGWPIIDALKQRDGFPETLNQHVGLYQQVKQFYKDQYWDRASLGKLDQAVAEEIFDTGVNQGLGTAVKHFQKALNVLNNNTRDYPDMKVDGGLGPLTISAYMNLIKTAKRPTRSHSKIIKVLLKLMNFFQMERYVIIVERSPEQEKFMFGWTERISS